jgi:hypothetical protein
MNRFLPLALLFVGSTAFAQDASDSHSVTVQVAEINTLEVIGGDLVLTLDTLDANDPSRFEPAVDTSASLAWSTNAQDRKITVESDLVDPRYALTVRAFDVTGNGAAVGTAQLDAAAGAQDLITGIAAESATCSLEYEANALVADGIGSETHTVTYTLTAI